MKRGAKILGLVAAVLLLAAAATAKAETPSKRVEVTQQGDFILIGNTLAHDCGLGIPPPIVGATDCNTGTIGEKNDYSPDIFWRAENGTATANSTITVDQAQSAAVLKLPENATVTHAYLYWAARLLGNPDNDVTLQCLPAAAGYKPDVKSSLTGVGNTYGVVGDVTSYVKANGSCTYLVSGVNSETLNKATIEPLGFAAWWMVVLYTSPTEPHRFLTVYDAFIPIGNSGTAELTVTGMDVPNSFNLFSNVKIGVVAYDGDLDVGDRFKLVKADKTEVPLSDGTAGSEMNFFNRSRTFFGSPVSVLGDLPQTSGNAGSLARLDMDVVDITSFITTGQQEVSFKADSNGEPNTLAAMILSIPTFTDEDGDTLSDDEETLFGTNPQDKDSDNDGLLDGQEGCSVPSSCIGPMWNVDSDGDGLLNALDPDSDDDGLYDGTEVGFNCDNPGTDKSQGHCIPDADNTTATDPLDDDTDDGGVIDGSEDTNLNGKVDMDETDPTTGHGSDDGTVVDTDGDGLGDDLEDEIGSDPKDADSDNDGLLDGEERNPTDDTDGDGLPNVLDMDSDNDGLFDGTEAGKDCSNPATDTTLGHCVADADPSTTTSPVDADSDNGGVSDGAEDYNLDGKLDPGETDSTEGHGDDDKTVKDTDGDGLSDELENTLGSDPNDTDSDDDGVPDGQEANPGNDEDGDGIKNVLDPDSDDDGLWDGTEVGNDCINPDIDKTAMTCIPDGDKGKTKTSMVDKDSDDGSVSDGDEDFDKDGVYDPNQGEGNPNVGSDDEVFPLCMEDSECGMPNDGYVCDKPKMICVPGCRNSPDALCPEGEMCTSTDDIIGDCVSGSTSSSGPGDDRIPYDGCICGVAAGSKPNIVGALLAVGCGLAVWRRRYRRPQRRDII